MLRRTIQGRRKRRRDLFQHKKQEDVAPTPQPTPQAEDSATQHSTHAINPKPLHTCIQTPTHAHPRTNNPASCTTKLHTNPPVWVCGSAGEGGVGAGPPGGRAAFGGTASNAAASWTHAGGLEWVNGFLGGGVCGGVRRWGVGCGLGCGLGVCVWQSGCLCRLLGALWVLACAVCGCGVGAFDRFGGCAVLAGFAVLPASPPSSF